MEIKKRIAGLQPLKRENQLLSFVSSDSGQRIDITYYFDKGSGHVFARVLFGEKAQGPPGHAHGGAIASVLDEAMGAAAWLNGFMVMTAKLEVSYLQALPLNREVYAEAWVDSSDEKKVRLKSRLADETGTVFSNGKGLFIQISKERIESMGPVPAGLL